MSHRSSFQYISSTSETVFYSAVVL